MAFWRPAATRAGRRTNLALAVLLPLAVLTGLFANTIGTRWGIPPAAVHGMVALAVLVVSPWKSLVVRRGYGKRRRSAVVSTALLLVVATTLATGLVHATGFRGRLGPLTVMQVHIGGALIALVLAFVHARSHPVRPRAADLDRRAFLSGAGVAVAATAGWLAIEGGLDVLGWSGGRRRFTGSHERASFQPARMPVTSWFDDRVQHVDATAWSVAIDGRRLGPEELAVLPHDDVTAVLDCTSGWYSEQVWTGVRLDRLLEADGARSVAVVSVTGYGRRFPAGDLQNLWLVTHVGGRPLSAGHGFPARLVAPGRRGFWWVKWVDVIESSDTPWWAQLPFPAT
jgi:DMSO/TMAO reductase YedYZ molybdopterin-dependent catalytic subunit